MAKTAKNTVKLSSWEKTHLKQLALVEKKIAAAYDELCKKAGVIGALNAGKVSPDKAFSLADYPDIRKQIDNALRELSTNVQVTIVDGVRAQWSLAEDKNDALCEEVLGSPRGKLPEALQKRYFAARNTEAVNSFIKRKEGGLNLSQRVWKYAKEAKVDIESALEIGIKSGQPASAIARDLKQYLQEPKKLFRRVRDEEGVLHLSSRAKEYHPGQGVYRSSYKNALRLAATECNMAYRESDYERWQQLDFVVGIEVKLSNNHTLNGRPFMDICDDLAGRYPKTFKFRGWHPFCRCHAVSILKTNEEIMADNKRILEGKEPLETSVNSVTEMPEGFKQWTADNTERILAADGRGTLPYFVTDNATTVATLADIPLKSVGVKPEPKVPTAFEVAAQRHAARTQERIDAIKQAYHERNAVYHYGDNILAYMGGISDVSISDLASALASGNLTRILNESRKLKSVGKEILGYSRLDNPMQVAKTFSMAEAKAVNEAVEKRLAGWSGLSLEKQKSNLNSEIKRLEANKKYSTWQVAQSAYVKELARVEDAINASTPAGIIKPIYITNAELNDTFKAINDALQDEKWFARGDLQISATTAGVNGQTHMDGRIELTPERLTLVKSAMGKIGQGKAGEITEKEADAMATLWHEITHNRNTRPIPMLTSEQVRYVELANEFVARKTLPEFYSKLGCDRVPHSEFMISRTSTGYNAMVTNYGYVISKLGLDENEVLKSVKKHLFESSYAQQKEGLINGLIDGGIKDNNGVLPKKSVLNDLVVAIKDICDKYVFVNGRYVLKTKESLLDDWLRTHNLSMLF